MNWFHILIEYQNSRFGGASPLGFTEDTLLERIVKPLNENKPFWFLGNLIYPSEIKRICIFESSEQDSEKIILPNGKKIFNEDNFDYIINSLRAQKVLNVVGICTNRFLKDTKKAVNKNWDSQIIPNETQGTRKNKIFIVHGKEKEQALELQKYLRDEHSLEAIIFEDVKKKFSDKTIDELLEHIVTNAAYAFIVATPDDLGYFGKDIEEYEKELLMGKETIRAENVTNLIAILNKRAAQNVVFEHGLFIGALGKERVCCLIQEDVTKQESNIDGILYENFKESVTEKFSNIENKLKDPKIGLIKKQ